MGAFSQLRSVQCRFASLALVAASKFAGSGYSAGNQPGVCWRTKGCWNQPSDNYSDASRWGTYEIWAWPPERARCVLIGVILHLCFRGLPVHCRSYWLVHSFFFFRGEGCIKLIFCECVFRSNFFCNYIGRAWVRKMMGWWAYFERIRLLILIRELLLHLFFSQFGLCYHQCFLVIGGDELVVVLVVRNWVDCTFLLAAAFLKQNVTQNTTAQVVGWEFCIDQCFVHACTFKGARRGQACLCIAYPRLKNENEIIGSPELTAKKGEICVNLTRWHISSKSSIAASYYYFGPGRGCSVGRQPTLCWSGALVKRHRRYEFEIQLANTAGPGRITNSSRLRWVAEASF